MLLALLKILFFFAVVLAIALGAQQLGEFGEPLRVSFNGQGFVLYPVQAVIALILVVACGWLLVQFLRLVLAFVRFLAGDKTAIDRYLDRKRERKGYQALAEGMLAVASGEGRLAQDKAAKAAKFLDQPHVTNVLAAQAAEAAGDARRAEEAYRDMLGDSRTRFVAVRGLMRQRLDQGDTATALRLAEKAYALKPLHTEMQDTLLSLQTRQHDWKGARSTLKDKRRQGALPQDVVMRRDAVLALQEAKEVLAEENSISAREAAISANRASPDLVPAAVLAARSYIAQKDGRSAARVLEKTWSVQPHPALAAAYAEIVPDEGPRDRLRRFEKLIARSPTNEESRLLQAELMLAAEDYPGARRALGNIAEKHPTVRSLSILAAVERGSGSDESLVRALLARALTASRGNQWVCDNCHNVMAEWSPVCDSCGAFDTLTWREPESDRKLAATMDNVTMLPLIVGPPPAPEPVAPTVVTETFVPPKNIRPESRVEPYAPSSTVTDAEPDEQPAPRPVAHTPAPRPVPPPPENVELRASDKSGTNPAERAPEPPAETAPVATPIAEPLKLRPEDAVEKDATIVTVSHLDEGPRNGGSTSVDADDSGSPPVRPDAAPFDPEQDDKIR